MKINIHKNTKCPLRHSCFEFFDKACADCAIGKEIVKLHNRIEYLKKKVTKAEQLKSGEIAKKLIPLKEYPKGLFIKGETLCVKTEYGNEAYIVWSGEYFWGGAESKEDIGNVPILPINDELVQMIERQYGERYKELAEGKNDL